MNLTAALDAIGVELPHSLELLTAPASLVDSSGTVLWQNAAAVALLGDRRGQRSRTAPPASVTTETVVVQAATGEETRIDAVSIPLSDGPQLRAVLKIAQRVSPLANGGRTPRLTPRELETLRLLEAGRSTDEIARELGIARETARNYIRRLLRTLGAHSRLAAVARARESGLL